MHCSLNQSTNKMPSMETKFHPKIPAELLLAELLSELHRFSFQWTFQVVGSSGPCVRLPAKHPAIGDLIIWVEDNEITVEVGRIWHSHFDRNGTYCLHDGEYVPFFDVGEHTVDEQARDIAQRASDFIWDVLSDLILFDMKWEGNRIASVSTIWLNESVLPPPLKLLPEDNRRERFLWSGPYA
jgi:hypothetical protein